ncbi:MULTISPECIES: CobW family GTP-binding protein [Actinoalloteichus]|uniref:GTPase, G3E family n=1 Tax=Actinoalloteichus fjordicus TaxID=1612552 RepID=A0AAC9LE35_9PSEU|nr:MULTISPECIES: GTP-binding protein [Actinoalloteichus]APU15671.1 putative GTPase, G3E family [Actinoalloteichus fjordicus]APU21731.1 putative GTPase, G3E family [Actinoalloteichus sp. GBA129-24]
MAGRAGARIPVVIVAGFLGAGKTTLLNHLLTNRAGVRIGVVVNDFGSIEIDAMTVAGQVDSMISLGNGCLCCAVDTSTMDELLDRLARPSAGIDVIVIEASGLAEPRDMIRLVLASENPRVEYGGLVEVVDAAEFESTRSRHPELGTRLSLADLIVVNKADRMPVEARPALLATVRASSPGTPVITTSHGRVDPELLFEPPDRPRPTERFGQLSFDQLTFEDGDAGRSGACEAGPDSGRREGGQHDDGCADTAHLHHAYETVSFTSDTPLHPRRLMAFLDDRPPGLYRMKGFVYFGVTGYRQKFGLHTVGAFLRFRRSRWSAGEDRTTRLVLIGSGIDAEAVRAALAACVEPRSAEVTEQDMLCVLKFVES